MAIIYRAVKGSNLTPTEVDGNFHDVDDRVTTLEGLPLGVGIESIDVSGNQMTITLTDDSIQGPFTLPMWDLVDLLRGEWTAATSYLTNEIVTALGSLWVVTHDHTSEAEFDPGANDTAGDFYALLLKNPAIPVFEVTADTFTPDLNYVNSYIRCSNAAGCVVTIPESGDLDFDLYTEFHFRQAPGAGVVSIEQPATGSPVVINAVAGYHNETAGEGATFFVKKVGTDEWDIGGLLAAGT
jgi:hypothetical protein